MSSAFLNTTKPIWIDVLKNNRLHNFSFIIDLLGGFALVRMSDLIVQNASLRRSSDPLISCDNQLKNRVGL